MDTKLKNWEQKFLNWEHNSKNWKQSFIIGIKTFEILIKNFYHWIFVPIFLSFAPFFLNFCFLKIECKYKMFKFSFAIKKTKLKMDKKMLKETNIIRVYWGNYKYTLCMTHEDGWKYLIWARPHRTQACKPGPRFWDPDPK